MSLPRNNGKLRACAECRRLKLRCDRNFPCQACVRRGCSSICPDKCFTDKPTPSSLKANTLRSREQIQTLEARIAALEKALGQENPSHPLISHESEPSSLESPDERYDLLEEADILGTLTIAEDGSTVFSGTAHGSKSLEGIKCFPDPHSFPLGDQPNLPNNLQLLSALFPFTPHSVASAACIDDFLPFLPRAEVTMEIITRFWHSFSLHSPVSRAQFMKHVYDTFYPNQKLKCHFVRSDAHRLGLLFIILALGILIDPNKSMLSLEAETYHQLSRAALSLDPVCDNTTVAALQAMMCLSWYTCMVPNSTSHGYEWAFQGMTIKLASSIGLFRDSRKWLSDRDEILQRELLCWELICMDLWTSFCNARPSSIDLSLVDCQRPSDADIQFAGPPILVPEYYSWKFSFFSLISKVLLVVLRPKPVKYSEILALERQLRECTMPPAMELPLHGSPLEGLPDDAMSIHFQRFTALIKREMASIMLHRRFLVLAMEKDCVDLENTPFKFSALRAGHSARWIITSQIIMYRRYPELIIRVPLYWSASFSAAIIIGAIAARYADRDFAHCALIPFEGICALFEETAGVSIQPAHALESLRRLQKRVRAHFTPEALSNRDFTLDERFLGLCLDPLGLPTPPRLESQSSPATTKASSPSDSSKENSPGLPMFSGSFGASAAGVPVSHNNVLDPTTAVWPAFDITYPSEDASVPAELPKGNLELPTSWSGGISEIGLKGTTADAEVGQWDQFLNTLGVWD